MIPLRPWFPSICTYIFHCSHSPTPQGKENHVLDWGSVSPRWGGITQFWWPLTPFDSISTSVFWITCQCEWWNFLSTCLKTKNKYRGPRPGRMVVKCVLFLELNFGSKTYLAKWLRAVTQSPCASVISTYNNHHKKPKLVDFTLLFTTNRIVV